MRITKMEKADETAWIIRVLAILIAVVVGYYLYWELIPIEVYYDVEQPYPVLNENHEVGRGEAVKVQQIYCKNGNYPAVVTVALENESGTIVRTLETVNSAVKEGCWGLDPVRVSETAEIANNVSNGKYRIVYLIHVHINAIRDEDYTLHSEYFNVID